MIPGLNDVHCLTKSWKWEKVCCSGTPPCERDSTSSIFYEGEMIIFGGRIVGGSYCRDLFSLDLENHHWEEIRAVGEIPKPTSSHTAVERNGFMYIFCRNGSSNLLDMYELDLSSYVWKKIVTSGDIPASRYSQATILVNNEVYIFGGKGKDDFLDDMFKITLPEKPKGGSPKLISLLEKKLLVDIHIIVDGFCIPAHKCILAQSKELKKLITESKVNENGITVVQLNSISETTFRLMLNFLYTGCVDLTEIQEADLIKLISASKQFGLENLELACLSQCSDKISVENVLKAMKLAHQHKLVRLKTICINFFLANRQEILAKEDILLLDKELMAELLKLDGEKPLPIENEKPKLFIQNHLDQLYISKEYSDIILVSKDGKKFPCHKPILVAASEYFALMFTRDFQESRQREIIIDSIDGNLLEMVLRFIYTGDDTFTTNFEILVELYQFAEMILLQDLSEVITKQMMRMVSRGNALEVLLLCLNANIEGKVKDRCHRVIRSTNKDELLDTIIEMQFKQQKNFAELQLEMKTKFKKVQQQLESEIKDLNKKLQVQESLISKQQQQILEVQQQIRELMKK